MTFNLSISSEVLPFGTYVITAYIPSGKNASVHVIFDSPADVNISIVKSIVEQYHGMHPYIPGFYVCTNMAEDVWSIVEMNGIPAKIAAGDVQNPNVTVYKYNHAWVLAEYAPGEWMAMETTGGFLVPHDPAYYRGIFFANMADFKSYIALTQNNNDEIALIENITSQYNAKRAEVDADAATLDAEVNTYNGGYAGQALSPGQYQVGQNLINQIRTQKQIVTQANDELNQLGGNLTADERVLTGIQSEIRDLVNRSRNL
jgi:hypothetical protein